MSDQPEVGDYRIVRHDERWDGSRSACNHWQVECLQWVKRAGQFTSEKAAQDYADQVSVTIKSYETSQRVLVHQRTVLLEAIQHMLASPHTALEVAKAAIAEVDSGEQQR